MTTSGIAARRARPTAIADDVLLAVNAGSSSLRLALFSADPGLTQLGEVHLESSSVHVEQVQAFLAAHGSPTVKGVVHRVVHGGMSLTKPCLVDPVVESEIERLASLAPLHNPAALAWIRACRSVLARGVKQVAVFDTGFFAGLPDMASTYGLPRELCIRHGIRRFGFHGLAHQAMLEFWCEQHPGRAAGKVISLQLGAGCSVAATLDGQPVDTSMGFSPLEGLIMATRCGDVDPGLLMYLLRESKLSVDELDRIMNEESGLLGISGISADMRELVGSRLSSARLAVDVFCYRVRKYIGAYLAVLDGADAILFGGGIGEHAPDIRSRILEMFGWSGIQMDLVRNASSLRGAGSIHAPSSKTEVWVVPVDESRLLARMALPLVTNMQGEPSVGSG